MMVVGEMITITIKKDDQTALLKTEEEILLETEITTITEAGEITIITRGKDSQIAHLKIERESPLETEMMAITETGETTVATKGKDGQIVRLKTEEESRLEIGIMAITETGEVTSTIKGEDVIVEKTVSLMINEEMSPSERMIDTEKMVREMGRKERTKLEKDTIEFVLNNKIKY
jgi:hypothetical protein